MRILFILLICFFSFTSLVFTQVGLTLGNEYGIGGILKIGSDNLKIEAGGGLAPFLFFVDVIGGENITKLYFPITIGGKINFRISVSESDNRLGLKFGCNYNNLIGIGIGGGVDYQINRDPNLYLGAGAMIFPDAKEKLRVKINSDENTNFSETEFSAPLASFQPFVSLSILF